MILSSQRLHFNILKATFGGNIKVTSIRGSKLVLKNPEKKNQFIEQHRIYCNLKGEWASFNNSERARLRRNQNSLLDTEKAGEMSKKNLSCPE